MGWRVALAFLIPTALFHEVWPWVIDRWFAAGSYFDHGPMIPVLALAWAVLLVRQGKIAQGGSPIFASLLALPAALGLFLLHGRDVGFFGAVGWWLGVGAMIVALIGPRGLRALIGPWFLLLFMIPWPLKLVDDLSLPLKSAAMDLGLLLAPGEAVREGEGSRILLPDGGVLLVGEVCSGLRSLVALLSFGYLAAALTRGGIARKAVVFLTSAPVAVLANGFRIAVLITFAEAQGAAVAAPGGFVHDVTAPLVYVLAIAVLLVLVRVVGSTEAGSVSEPPALPRSTMPARPAAVWIVATTMILASGYVLAIPFGGGRDGPSQEVSRLIPHTLELPAGSDPSDIGSFDIPLDQGAANLLRPDECISRIYGDFFHLCVVHGRGQRTQLHAPEICYRGNGYEVLSKSEIANPRAFIGAPENLQEILLLKGSEQRLTWYWYRSGRTSSSSYGQFSARAILRPSEPQVLVWLSCPIDEDGLDLARQRLRWFLGALGSSLEDVMRVL